MKKAAIAPIRAMPPNVAPTPTPAVSPFVNPLSSLLALELEVLSGTAVSMGLALRGAIHETSLPVRIV